MHSHILKSSSSRYTEVVAAVISRKIETSTRCSSGMYGMQYLLSQRRQDQSFTGFWEFPGGKVEPNEPHLHALRRELMEELGINIDTQSCQPLISIPWQYDGGHLNLHFYGVQHYALSVYPAEGQKIQWWCAEEIDTKTLLPANRGLMQAINLPDYYAISGDFKHVHDFIRKITQVCQKGVQFMQLRMTEERWKSLLKDDVFASLLSAIAKKYHCRFVLNAQCTPYTEKTDGSRQREWQLPSPFEHSIVGWHLRSADLVNQSYRAIIKAKKQYPAYLWSASVHHQEELAKSEKIGVDFICLSPVLPTSSNDQKTALGFKKLQQLTHLSTVPVYYLGGLSEQHLTVAKKHGAQGIAGISLFWQA